MVTTVPVPTADAMANSSINRRAPGRPMPRPLPVEKPSRMTVVTSAMPGPWSAAMISTPFFVASLISVMITSPSFAYSTMFRATSEIAVAMIVRLLCEKPACDARLRPCCRAATMSAEFWIRTCTWLSLLTAMAFLEPLIEQREALLEIEGGQHVLECQSKLHHRLGDVGLNADDHGLGAAQLGHIGDGAQSTRGERVEHIQRGHVDDHSQGAVLPDQPRQVVAQAHQILIAERRLDARDQVMTLLEDRNGHEVLVPLIAALSACAMRPRPRQG